MNGSREEAAFWRGRWDSGQIGFHEGAPNAHLVRHVALLESSPAALGARVLVPLCGKSVDLRYLAERGHHVVGCELVERAAGAFFAEASVAPAASAQVPFDVLEAPIGVAGGSVRVLVGDALALTRAHTGDVDAVFDRAALIALPKDLRAAYAACVLDLLAPGGRVLLVTLEHDVGAGPPHSVPRDEVEALYGARTIIEPLGRAEVTSESPSLVAKGATRVHEAAYLLTVR